MTEGRRPHSYVPVSITDGVRSSARRWPTKIALSQGSRQLTYSELVTRIDRVSNAAISDLGLLRGQHAALMAPNCLEFIEIVGGLAAAGIAPAMINPRSTPGEIAFICNDSEAKVLFVHADLEDVARSAECHTVEEIIVIGPAYEQWLGNARATPPKSQVDELDIFCIPYTAGTTGKPKGVLLPHRSRTLTFFAMGVEFGCYTPDDRALGVAPLFHGAGFAFAMAPIFFGGSCEILPRFDPEEVLRLLHSLALTNVFMVPTHFHALFALDDSILQRFRPPALNAIISNAAPLTQVMKERIVDHFGGGLLFEQYGSTEAGIVSSLRPADQLRKHQCVGLPFPCTSIRLCDADGEDVASGEVGELYSRSPYLFSGYWNRPGQAEKRFRDGWFSAGDLARFDEEGYVYLIDRIDDRIISGGINIYPREVEEVIARHPAVSEVAVFGVPDERWGESVRAAVVLRPGEVLTVEELGDFCNQYLARYKRPKAVDFVPELPRNASGKLLRRTLRESFATAGVSR